MSVRTGVTKDSDIRRAILESAVSLFSKLGYSATSVQEVVDAAGVTKGAFYYYFDSKESLLLEIHDVFHDFALVQAREIIGLELSPIESISRLMYALLRQVDRFLPHMSITFQESPYIDFTKYPASLALRNEYEALFLSIVERGIADKSLNIDPANSHVATYGIMGMCVWAYHWYKPAGPLSAEEIARTYVRIIIDGIDSRPRVKRVRK